MQTMMATEEIDPLDPELFPIPLLNSCTYASPRNAQSVAVVEAGKQLLVAAKEGDVERVRQLISKGAPFTTDWLGVSPLHLAAQHDHITTAEVLLRAGISRDARTKVERTPLHLAAQEGHTAMVELLITQGADVNCRDMLRMTPLHWAVEKEHADVAEALLKAGAEPYAVSKFGKTPMSIARDMARSDITHILETTESVPIVTLQQTEEMHQSALEATETLTADLNMTDSITRQLAAAAAAAEMHSSSPQVSTPTVNVSEASNTMQLLQAHGITMLPTDKTTIVESAMESGQTVVLTEAGKMALNLTGMGGRIIGTKRPSTAVRTVGPAKAAVTSAAALSGTLSGGIQKRPPTVLGNASRIIKIHPSQLVSLGGGRVSVQMPSFKVDQLLMQQSKVPNLVKRVVPAGKLQRVILSPQQQPVLQQQVRRQSQENEPSDEESKLIEETQGVGAAPDNLENSLKIESSHSANLARIEKELAEARKQAAEYKERMEKKEREAELYLQQLQSLKSATK